MIWTAVEDIYTGELSPFEETLEEDALGLMEGYKVNLTDCEKFRIREVEGGEVCIYDGVIYKGGFGCNLWAATKFAKLN